MHWVPGYRDKKATSWQTWQAKVATKEMVGADLEEIPIKTDRKEATAEIKKNVKEKCQREFELSEKADQVQEVFSEVGSRKYFGKNDRHNIAMLN